MGEVLQGRYTGAVAVTAVFSAGLEPKLLEQKS